MSKIIGYIRVSTSKQADEGHSLDAQRAKLQAYANLYELDLVGIHVDAGLSGKSLDRPALQQALADLKSGKATGLLTMKLDRLSRSVADMGRLMAEYFNPRSGYQLIAVNDSIDTSTASGRLVVNILASVAQWEREATGERVSSTMAHMRESGQYTGGQPRYGYKVSKDGSQLEKHEAEQRVIRSAQAMHLEGRTLSSIAKALNVTKFRTRGGGLFQVNQIKGMLAQ